MVTSDPAPIVIPPSFNTPKVPDVVSLDKLSQGTQTTVEKPV